MSDQELRLWDGKPYDVARLKAISPGLVEYARARKSLDDTIRLSDVEARQRRKPVRFRTVLLSIGLLHVFVAVGCLASGMPWFEILLVMAGVAVPCAALLLLCAACRFDGEELPRVLTVRDGVVTVQTPKGTQRFKLAECCWFPGRLYDDPSLRHSLAKGRAIILVCPSGKRLACGLEETHRRRWRAFLEIAGVRRVWHPEGAVGCLMVFGSIGVSILAGFAGWYLTDWMAAALQRCGFPALVAELPPVAAVVSVWAAYLAVQLGVPGWYQGTHEVKAGLYRFAALVPMFLLGRGRRGLGLAKWGLALRIPIVLLLSAILCSLTWLILRTVERRRRQRDLARS